MKKITALFPDDVELDLGSLATHAIEIHMETIGGGVKIGGRSKVKKASDDKPKRKARKAPDEPGATDIIMESFRKGRTFTRSQAIEWIVDRGYAAASVSAAISRLKKSGKIGDTDTSGTYVYLEK